MFWRFGGYANVSTLETILDKPDVTLEELLDEADLIQELKQHNAKLIEFLRDEGILKRLLDYVITPPLVGANEFEIDEEAEADEAAAAPKPLSPMRSLSLVRPRGPAKTKRQEERDELDKAEKSRQKYAYVACEVLSSETWSIIEAMLENHEHLRHFWDFLKRPAPLDAIAAGYFTKINETLLDKKTEEMMEFVKTLDNIMPAMLQHVDCLMVMDLLLKMISMEKSDGGQGIVDWLQSQDLMPLLLDYLGKNHPTFTQTSAGDFIKAIITISANASQNEQSCIGPNSLTRQLVSESCVEKLIADMLRGGNALTVGVGIIIEVIRKNNSDYDPDLSNAQDQAPSSSDPIYLGTLLRLFAKNVPDFTELILSPNHTVSDGDTTKTVKRQQLDVAFGGSIEPLGFDRFKTCELMAELLHCSNMGLLNETGSEAHIKQRDEEREKLRAEGVLHKTREPLSAITEFSEDSNGFHADDSALALDTSANEARRLGVTNNSEDDGFEEVGTLADFSDEVKDDFDEKSPFELEDNAIESPSQLKPSKSRLSLDDEFFDEPLTSPRLGPVQPESESTSLPSILESQPPTLSPTIFLASDVEDIALVPRMRAAENTSIQDTSNEATLTEGTSNQSIYSESTATKDLVHAITSQIPNQSPGIDVPPLPHRDRRADAEFSLENSRLEDQPAPLFITKTSEDSSLPSGDECHHSNEHVDEYTDEYRNQHMDEKVDRRESIDTTRAHDDGARSPLIADDEDFFTPLLENDLDGRPIVGDYLKMMFVEHKVVPTILDFFFRFPWNNFLHNVVYDVVQQVFNGPMDRGYNRFLAIDLFQSGRITERIIEGQLRSDEAQARNNMRLGYMGHLTLIAEEVVKFSERHPAELLSPDVLEKVSGKPWSDYVENVLSETRERDNAILGGIRPDHVGGPRQAVLNAVNAAHSFGNSTSSALANAGLNGGTSGLDGMELSGQSVQNFLGGGSLLSGFGSSSDEEDEDMEEITEHEGGTERDLDQYQEYAPSSLSALSIFSPPLEGPQHATSMGSGPAVSADPGIPLPPPLNIPPSRARRQLAARLALKSGTSPFVSPEPSPANQNPLTRSQDPLGSSSLTQPLSLNHIADADDDDEIWSRVRSPQDRPIAEAELNGHQAMSERRGGDWVDFDGSDDEDLFEGDVGRGERRAPEVEVEEDDGIEDVPLTMVMHVPKPGSRSKRNSIDKGTGGGGGGGGVDPEGGDPEGGIADDKSPGKVGTGEVVDA